MKNNEIYNLKLEKIKEILSQKIKDTVIFETNDIHKTFIKIYGRSTFFVYGWECSDEIIVSADIDLIVDKIIKDYTRFILAMFLNE